MALTTAQLILLACEDLRQAADPSRPDAIRLEDQQRVAATLSLLYDRSWSGDWEASLFLQARVPGPDAVLTRH